jgi:hypothetical protein
MDQDNTRVIAHRKWEEEGRPEGQHERHWAEAEREHETSTGPTQTMPSAHNSGVSPPTRSEGVPAVPKDLEEPSNDWPAADGN